MQKGTYKVLREVNGVYDGLTMMAEDGRSYPISKNYASKSQIVEGDKLKLSITEDGEFIYKQTLPVPRRREICTIVENMENGALVARDEVGNTFKINTSSLSYLGAMEGDEAVCIFPKKGVPEWAVLEGIITKKS